ILMTQLAARRGLHRRQLALDGGWSAGFGWAFFGRDGGLTGGVLIDFCVIPDFRIRIHHALLVELYLDDCLAEMACRATLRVQRDDVLAPPECKNRGRLRFC